MTGVWGTTMARRRQRSGGHFFRESLGKSLLAGVKPADREVACRRLGQGPGVGRLGLGPLLADRERLMLRLERVRGLPRARQDIADVAVDIGWPRRWESIRWCSIGSTASAPPGRGSA